MSAIANRGYAIGIGRLTSPDEAAQTLAQHLSLNAGISRRTTIAQRSLLEACENDRFHFPQQLERQLDRATVNLRKLAITKPRFTYHLVRCVSEDRALNPSIDLGSGCAAL